MLIKIAWRNIWRNKRRTLIVLTSIVVGLLAILLNNSLSIGMIHQVFTNQIGSHISHIQIHKNGFTDNNIVQNYLPDHSRVENALKRNPLIESYSRRVITFGLLSSASNSSGTNIIGIMPEEEEKVTKIKISIVEGSYLSGEKREIVIGRKLAEKLEVGLGDKVVAMASALDGTVGADVFRVVGLYETFSSEFDKYSVYVSLANAQELLALGMNISEFAMITKDVERVTQIRDDLISQLDESYEVLSYDEIVPLLVMQMDIHAQSMFIVYIIVGAAMIFGIVNSMLMSVFERIQEFGVLMALGMKNTRIFLMVVSEAFLLGILGSVIGLAIGYVIYVPLSHSGLDLSVFSEALTAFGAGATIYPVLTIQAVLSSIVIIPFIAVLGAIYPAFKAIRLQPVNAIRYV